MRSRTKRVSAAAVASMFAVASAGGAALAVPESGGAGSSSADIAIEDCVLESSKEISYVAYLADGEAVSKDESVDSESLDLTTVEGIEDVDAVEVKAGTTVQTFDITCAPDDGETGGAGDEDDGETGGAGEEDADEGDDTDKVHGNGRANANSTATISLADCVVESTKDISYVEYLTDGEAVSKDESVDSETFDLTTVEGIEDVDAVEVKAGTTVEAFDITCAPEEDDGTTGGAGEEDTDTGDDTEGTGDDTEGTGDDTEGTEDDTDTGEETDAAVITLSGCTVESTKDISNIEFFSGDTSWKDESMNSETFDLTTVEGIEDVDSIAVKSSTTVEEFAITCGTEDGAEAGDGGAASGSGETDSTNDSDDTEQESDEVEETDESDSDAPVADSGTEGAESEDETEDTEVEDADDADDDKQDNQKNKKNKKDEDDSEETEDD